MSQRMALRRWYVFGVLGRFAFLKMTNFEKCQDRSTPICHGLVLSCSYVSPLRNKKVISEQANGFMKPKFRKLEFLENIDVGDV